MKIAAIADTHGADFKVPDCDVLIHAGDACEWGKFSEFIKFVALLREIKVPRIVYVPGNHDRCVQNDTALCRSLLLENATMLVDESVTIDGVTFYGSPWTLPMGTWSYMAEDTHLQQNYQRRMIESVDILITHGPPAGYFDGNTGEGVASLNEAISLRPSIRKHIFGHFHEDGGKNDGFHYNVAAKDLSYRMVRGCTEIEI